MIADTIRRLPFCKIFLLVILFLMNTTYGIGTRFLIVPANVSELGLGPNPVLGDQTHFNPARITSGTTLSASGGNWLAQIPLSGIRATTPILNGKFSIYGRYTGIDDLELRPEYPVDEPLAGFAAYGMSLTGAYAWAGPRLAVGGSISYIDIGIHSEFSRGASISAGLEYKITPDIRMGASILNLGRMSEFRNDSPSLPIRSSFGARLDHAWKDWGSKIAISADFTDGSKAALRLAEEVTWKDLSIMAGTGFQKDNFNISGGVNFSASSFRIGYGFMVGQNRLGIAQIIEIAFNIE